MARRQLCAAGKSLQMGNEDLTCETCMSWRTIDCAHGRGKVSFANHVQTARVRRGFVRDGTFRSPWVSAEPSRAVYFFCWTAMAGVWECGEKGASCVGVGSLRSATHRST